jgi:hypothetical protein
MNTLHYLFKVCLLSGLLYGYYWCLLRNKQFHGYNRIYLLGTAAVSLVLPILNFPIRQGYPVYNSGRELGRVHEFNAPIRSVEGLFRLA